MITEIPSQDAATVLTGVAAALFAMLFRAAIERRRTPSARAAAAV